MAEGECEGKGAVLGYAGAYEEVLPEFGVLAVVRMVRKGVLMMEIWKIGCCFLS